MLNIRFSQRILFIFIFMQRFLPSEFGNDVDRTVAIEPALSEFIMKAQIRRAIEAAGIPYTYVVTGCFAGFFVPSLGQCHLRLRTPPTDKVSIYDSGDAKGTLYTHLKLHTHFS